jgi:hypothetical protein
VVFTGLLTVWAVLILDAAVVAILASSDKSPSQDPQLGRLIGVSIGMLLVIAGPLVIWIRRLLKVWKNTARAVEHARLLKRIAIGAVAGYSLAAIGIRILAIATLPAGVGFGQLSELAIALGSIVAAGFATLPLRGKRAL